MVWVSGCAADSSAGPKNPSASDSPAPLVTGKSIEDHVGEASQDIGSMPINMVASADGRFALTTDIGAREAVWSIRTSDGKGVGHVEFPNVHPSFQKDTNGLYYGLAVAADNTVYAAQGHHDAIAVLKLASDGSLTKTGSIATKAGDFPSGLALDGRGMLYVANNDPVGASPTFDAPASVAIYQLNDGKEIGRFRFTDTIAGTSNFPLSV